MSLNPKPSLSTCRERVRLDFEESMGITDLLEGQPNKEDLDVIEEARRALEPVIERTALELYRWYRR